MEIFEVFLSFSCSVGEIHLSYPCSFSSEIFQKVKAQKRIWTLLGSWFAFFSSPPENPSTAAFIDEKKYGCIEILGENNALFFQKIFPSFQETSSLFVDRKSVQVWVIIFSVLSTQLPLLMGSVVLRPIATAEE